ncbi:MAG: methyltransferase domain-containing protein [Candidatus Lokiarchaeota archaeon]|nr:methyltransferase domain-containing protein [Candidatus Lokiarchaeota archaeon]
MLERRDLRAIFEIVKPNSKVLDLGCGDGLLLRELVLKKKVDGLGIEISLEKIKSCLNNGISVIQEDLNEGLKDFKDNTFDYIVLSQTLEYIAHPIYLIQEMLRVGKKVVISFENLAYWKNRITFLLNGDLKRARANDHSLFFRKKIQILTVKKFYDFCSYNEIQTSNQIYLPIKKLNFIQTFPNLLSKIAIFILMGEN